MNAVDRTGLSMTIAGIVLTRDRLMGIGQAISTVTR